MLLSRVDCLIRVYVARDHGWVARFSRVNDTIRKGSPPGHLEVVRPSSRAGTFPTMVMRASSSRIDLGTVAWMREAGWDRFDHVALEGVTLGLRRTERVAVAGPEGSGKTTLLRLLGALSIPTSGTVVVLGTRTEMTAPRDLVALRSRIGFVHRSFYIELRMSVGEVVENVLVRRHRAPVSSERVDHWLRVVDMEQTKERSLDSLDDEGRIRIAIACTIAGHPDLVLADDLASHLPGLARRRINRLLFDLCDQQGLTLVSGVRDVDSIPGSATRLVGLSSGSVILDAAL